MGTPHYSVDCADYHSLVRDFGGPRPTITVLCGSTRFGNVYAEHNLRLTVAGHIVLSIGCDTKADADLDLAAQAGDGRGLDEIKANLDELHKRKIDLADEVLVLNVNGYVGRRGERYGRLVVAEDRLPGQAMVSVQCDCGRALTVRLSNLGRSAKSCGCSKKGQGNPRYRHGGAGSTLYYCPHCACSRCEALAEAASS